MSIFKKLIAGIVLVFGLLTVGAVPAFAADGDGTTVIIAGTTLTWVTAVQLLVLPILLPALVGWVTKNVSIASFWKRAILFGLSLLGQILTEIVAAAVANRPYDLILALFMGAVAYAAAEVSYQNFYKVPLKVGETAASGNPTLTALEPLPASTTKAVAIESYNNLIADVIPSAQKNDETPPPTTLATKIAGN